MDKQRQIETVTKRERETGGQKETNREEAKRCRDIGLVCVCESERKRLRERERDRDREKEREGNC